ncbi:uncharacterized protein F5147DRAFT_647866 [Suillus discolor]|uniref:Uncharacterized protein n=1 Tax=Suillus discolor TaxID=1912936 RepID=A0A9P7FJQ9_9AGAM|nr:uncharacterized protein F5147DRAFT_647866 [Suillus discolor]KAG2118713.1 hypothetical protein F5147DRAFT_647866 [Suillus discolor]
MNLLIIDHLAVVIIFKHSFYIFDKRCYLQDKESDPSFHVALEQYMASLHAAAVRKGVSPAIQAYEEAVATATYAYEEAVRTVVYPYQGNLPAWMAKLLFEPFKRKAKEAFEHSQAKAKEDFQCSQAKEKKSLCSQAKAESIEAVLEIALNHRLHNVSYPQSRQWREPTALDVLLKYLWYNQNLLTPTSSPATTINL